jgi:hypothetical protein
MYKCKTCLKEFTTSQSHNAHVSHHSVNIRQRIGDSKTCIHCGISAESRPKILNHIRNCTFNPNYEKNKQASADAMKRNFDNTGKGARSRSALEKASTEALKQEGYEVFFPWVVCDRIAIKDGKVYFVEFKDEGQVLKFEQQMVHDLAPDMYLIKRYKRV